MTDLVSAARRAVADACIVCRQVQANLDIVRSITKDDRSPVTVADFASQAVVAHALTESLGARIHLVGEESSTFLRDESHSAHLAATLAAVREVWPDCDEKSLLDAIDLGGADPLDHPEGFWTLDPVDGTKGFLRNQQYAVALAYIDHGNPALGVMGCPNLPRDFSAPLDEPDRRGCIYLAVRAGGLYELPADEMDAAPEHVVRPERAPGQPVSICESVESAHSDQSATARILARLGPTREPARLDSQCKYAVVARGQADAYLRLPTKKGYVERIWDHAAGALVAAEAGCYVTDIRGRDLDFSQGRGLEKNLGIVCAPPRLHGDVIRAIADLGLDRAPE